MPTPVLDRILAKTSYDHGCWTFNGFRDDLGYGRIWNLGGSQPVHRAIFEALHGQIPAGMVCDHRCRNTSCCNPDHLDVVTHGENARRGIAGKVNGERFAARTHCQYGHELTLDNMYRTKEGRRKCRICTLSGQKAKRPLSRARDRARYATDPDFSLRKQATNKASTARKNGGQ